MSTHSLPHPHAEDNAPHVTHHRKETLVALGEWALATGRWALVWAVTWAIRAEGLRDA